MRRVRGQLVWTWHGGVAFLTALAVGGVAHAAISTSGQVTPSYPGGNPWTISPQRLLVGNTTNGQLTINNGSFVSANGGATLGNLVGGNGILNLDGGGSGLNFFTPDMIVGAFGVGGVYMDGNAFLDVQNDLVLGGLPTNGYGEIRVTDTNRVRAEGNLYLGGDATADGGQGYIFRALGGATDVRFQVGNAANAALLSDPTDTVIASHSNGSGGNIVVRHGSGIDLPFFDLYLGLGGGNQGSLRVTGASSNGLTDSLVELASVNVGVQGGSGTLTVDDGGVAELGAVGVANASGSTGTVNVTGGGHFEANALSMGGLSGLAGGVGTLNLQDTNSRVVLGVDVASITGTTLLVNSSALTVRTGSVANTQGAAYFGYESGRSGVLRVEGSTSLFNHVGTTQMAFETGSSAEATVGENGRWANTGSVVLGREGAATLAVTSGGTAAFGGDLYAGFEAGGSGDITINVATIDIERSLVLGGDESTDGGVGSLTMTSTSGRLLVGDDADDFPIIGTPASVMVSDDDTVGGKLVVRNGSTLTTVGGAWIASGPGEFGAVRVVDFGSTWNASGTLVVGRSGQGELDVDGGEVVNSGDLIVGLNSAAAGQVELTSGIVTTTGDLTLGSFGGAVGTVNLSGPSGRLNVGDRATSLGTAGGQYVVVADDDLDGGNLLLRNGSTLTAGSLEVGKGAGNRGALLADGAGTNVTLTGDLTLGDDGGTGDATLSNSALVEADTVTAFSGSTIELSNQGRIKTRSLNIENGATLRGGGNVDPMTFATDPGVTNAGRVEPGNSIGDLYVGGHFTQTAPGTVQIEIDATGPGIVQDLLLANGDIDLAGTLELVTFAGSDPAYYVPRTVIESDESVAGVFEAVTGVVIDASKWWAVVYLARDVQVVAALPGDANLNGQVEQADLDAVLQNWGKTSVDDGVSWATGDYNGNGQVEQADLDAVLQNWGDTAAPDLRGLAVPEPAALGMIVSVCLVCRVRRAGRA